MAPEYNRGEVILSAKDVGRRFGSKVVLRDVDLEIRNLIRPGVQTGQVVALLGASGRGKTQLFHILAGLKKPDGGTVLIGPEQVPVKAGMVGVVGQSYPLFMHRTIMANLVIAGVQAGLSHRAAREKALDYLKQFGLEEHAGAYPAQVSGGQRQRVAIIQQIMCSEHFLLMDEPFSGLDVIALGKVARLISKIANLDDLNTIVVVTHSIAAAVEVADTVWLLGYDKDALGNPIPGARIQRTYDLIERGLAWREDITKDPLFFEVVREITADFHQV